MGRRFRHLACTGISLALFSCASTFASPALSSTYVPNCGTTAYLDFKPDQWSAGCTGGSLNLDLRRWTRYGARKANAVGVAILRRPCGTNPTCPEAGVYRAAAKLRVWRPRRCRAGGAAGARYFGRALVRIRYRGDNPFGQRAGWKSYRFNVRAYEGSCDYTP